MFSFLLQTASITLFNYWRATSYRRGLSILPVQPHEEADGGRYGEQHVVDRLHAEDYFRIRLGCQVLIGKDGCPECKIASAEDHPAENFP